MNEYLDPIFGAKTTDDVCSALQAAIDSLRLMNYLTKIPHSYKNIAAGCPMEIQTWFDKMRDDEQAKEEGNLKEIYGLFSGAVSQLRQLGFRREYPA